MRCRCEMHEVYKGNRLIQDFTLPFYETFKHQWSYHSMPQVHRLSDRLNCPEKRGKIQSIVEHFTERLERDRSKLAFCEGFSTPKVEHSILLQRLFTLT